MLAAAATVFVGLFSTVSAQSVSGSIGNGTVKRGGSAKGTVVLSIPGGLHVNSNRPRSEFAIATSVRLTGRGVTVGRASYPPGRNRKFSFSEEMLNVYEGRVPMTFTVSVPSGFKGNSISIRAVVKYQACTNEICYAPTSKEVTLTARVR